MAPRTARGDAGFSLPEMMISMGIMLVVLAGTFTAMTTAMNAEQTASNLTTMNGHLRSSMDLVVRDFLQVGQGLPVGRVIGIPNGPGAAQITPARPGGRRRLRRRHAVPGGADDLGGHGRPGPRPADQRAVHRRHHDAGPRRCLRQRQRHRHCRQRPVADRVSVRPGRHHRNTRRRHHRRRARRARRQHPRRRPPRGDQGRDQRARGGDGGGRPDHHLRARGHAGDKSVRHRPGDAGHDEPAACHRAGRRPRRRSSAPAVSSSPASRRSAASG